MTPAPVALLKAYARAMAAQAALLDAHADALLTDAADVRADAPPACPHPEEARIDLATLSRPYRFACRACGATINDVRQEVSHGSPDR